MTRRMVLKSKIQFSFIVRECQPLYFTIHSKWFLLHKLRSSVKHVLKVSDRKKKTAFTLFSFDRVLMHKWNISLQYMFKGKSSTCIKNFIVWCKKESRCTMDKIDGSTSIWIITQFLWLCLCAPPHWILHLNKYIKIQLKCRLLALTFTQSPTFRASNYHHFKYKDGF